MEIRKDENMKAKSWITAPKYMHIETALRKYAQEADIKIEIHTDKGLFRETTFWEAEGSESQLLQLKHDWNKFVEENS